MKSWHEKLLNFYFSPKNSWKTPFVESCVFSRPTYGEQDALWTTAHALPETRKFRERHILLAVGCLPLRTALHQLKSATREAAHDSPTRPPVVCAGCWCVCGFSCVAAECLGVCAQAVICSELLSVLGPAYVAGKIRLLLVAAPLLRTCSRRVTVCPWIISWFGLLSVRRQTSPLSDTNVQY